MDSRPMMMIPANGQDGSSASTAGAPIMILQQPVMFAAPTNDGSGMQGMPQYIPVYTTGNSMGQRQWMMPFGSVMSAVPQVTYSSPVQQGSPSFGTERPTSSSMMSSSSAGAHSRATNPVPRRAPQYSRPAPLPPRTVQRTPKPKGRPRKNPKPAGVVSSIFNPPGAVTEIPDYDDDLDLHDPDVHIMNSADATAAPTAPPAPTLRWSLEEDFTIVESHSKYMQTDDWEAIWRSLPNPQKYTPEQVKQRWIELSNEQPTTRPKRNPVSAYGSDMISIDEALGDLDRKPKKRKPNTSFNPDLSFANKRAKIGNGGAASATGLLMDLSSRAHSSRKDEHGEAVSNWTFAEEDKLKSWVKTRGNSSWDAAVAEFPGKTAADLRDRWFHHLDSALNRGLFTEQEDEAILRLQYEIGPAWAEISRRMGTMRPPADVAKRHRYLTNELDYQGASGNYARKLNARALKAAQLDHLDPQPEPELARSSRRRADSINEDSDAAVGRPESHDSRQHSAAPADDDVEMEVSLPFDSPELTLPDQPARRPRGRPRKQPLPARVDPNDDIDSIIEQHLKSVATEDSDNEYNFESPVIDPVDSLEDIAEVKTKYNQLAERFKTFAEEHQKALRKANLREQRLAQQLSDQEKTITSLKSIKFLDVGQATVKLLSYEDPTAFDHSAGVAL